MKSKFYFFVALLVTFSSSILPAIGQKSGSITDTVIMGNGYASEVYYNLSTGTKASDLRNQWDIAFRTSIRSASIITNDGSGVILYTYPKADTSGWATLDTAGFATWKPMYNSLKDWELGAFNTHSYGDFDYGWGVYSVATHNLTGDSIYIIKLRNGQLRKLWIIGKASSLNIYSIKTGGLDGLNELQKTIECNSYATKNFVGFSIPDNATVDFEPTANTSWDLLFTKYMGLSGTTPYPFVGVLSNYNTGAVKYQPVPLDFRTWDASLMDSSRAKIGSDWKVIDASFDYHIVDSTVYFVQDMNGNIHKLVFKEFAKSPIGRIVFEKEMISAAGINNAEVSGFNAAVYPNPVNVVMNVAINPGFSDEVEVALFDISGHPVFNQRYKLQSEVLSTLQIPVTTYSSGIYVARIQAGKNIVTRKVVLNN